MATNGIGIRELQNTDSLNNDDVILVDGFDQTTPTGSLSKHIKYEDLKSQILADLYSVIAESADFDDFKTRISNL